MNTKRAYERNKGQFVLKFFFEREREKERKGRKDKLIPGRKILQKEPEREKINNFCFNFSPFD